MPGPFNLDHLHIEILSPLTLPLVGVTSRDAWSWIDAANTCSLPLLLLLPSPFPAIRIRYAFHFFASISMRRRRRETWEVVQYGGAISKARHALAVHMARGAHSGTDGRQADSICVVAEGLERIQMDCVISTPGWRVKYWTRSKNLGLASFVPAPPLPLLPGFACSNHSTWGPPFSRAL